MSKVSALLMSNKGRILSALVVGVWKKLGRMIS